MVIEVVGAPGEKDMILPVLDEERKKNRGGTKGAEGEGTPAVPGQSLTHPLGVEPHTVTDTALRLSSAMVAP